MSNKNIIKKVLLVIAISSTGIAFCSEGSSLEADLKQYEQNVSSYSYKNALNSYASPFQYVLSSVFPRNWIQGPKKEQQAWKYGLKKEQSNRALYNIISHISQDPEEVINKKEKIVNTLNKGHDNHGEFFNLDDALRVILNETENCFNAYHDIEKCKEAAYIFSDVFKEFNQKLFKDYDNHLEKEGEEEGYRRFWRTRKRIAEELERLVWDWKTKNEA